MTLADWPLRPGQNWLDDGTQAEKEAEFEGIAAERPGWHSLRRSGLAAGHGEASGIGIHVTSPWLPKTPPSRPVNGRTTRQIDTNETTQMRPDPVSRSWKNGNGFLLYEVARGLDPNTPHLLEIEPVFDDTKAQELKIESLCVAGGKATVPLRQLAQRKAGRANRIALVDLMDGSQ